MKKWFDKMDKNKKRIMGVGIVALVLLLTLSAWGVYTIMVKPQDNVAKGDTIEGKGSEAKKDKKDEKGASTQKDEDKSTVGREDKKDAEEGALEADVTEEERTEQKDSVDAGTSTQQGGGNTTPTAPSNTNKNVNTQENKNSSQGNQVAAPTQTQGTTSKQENQQPSQSQNQNQAQSTQNPTPVAPTQNPTPTTPESKPETKPSSQPKEEEKQPVWHDPVYERRWVVDQAAWDETVTTPVYETRTVWYCSTCNANISADPEGHLDETRHGGYWSTGESVQVGTNTSTVHHDEVGHWEEVMVKDGYWE